MKLLTIAVVAAGVTWLGQGAAVPALAPTKLTPGTAALLIDPQGPADHDALRDGIADADPVVRTVTARIAGLLNRTDLIDGLADVLAGEQDATAATEQVRALLYLRGEMRPETRAAGMRLGGTVRSVSAEWLARTHPAAFAATLPGIVREMPESGTRAIGSIAAMAVRQTPGERDRIAAALAAAGSADAWREFLDRGGPELDADVATLTLGLAAASASVRDTTIWFVVSALAGGRSIRMADPHRGVAAAGAIPAIEESEWAAFGQQLLARRFGKAPAIDGSGAIARHALENRIDARALAPLSELTNAERSALRTAFPDLTVPDRGREPSPPKDDSGKGPAAALPMRTVTSLAPGFLSSLLAATKCTPASQGDAFGAARIAYRPDGRPGEAAFDTRTLQPPCALFVRALGALTVTPRDQPVVSAVPHWLYVAMEKDAIGCADETQTSVREEAQRLGGKIQPPKKLKDLRPIYPEAMQRNRVQGTVTIEALISATGCVTGAKILRSVEIPLDLAALRAVLGWRFSPALVDEKAVPVIMTVTVNFTLR